MSESACAATRASNQLRRRPWMLPDEADAGTVAAVVRRCPSGALLYRGAALPTQDGGPEGAHGGTSATAIRNGPAAGGRRDRGPSRRRDHRAASAHTLYLRRGSYNKPLCDDHHLTTGFKEGAPLKVHPTPARPQVEVPIARDEDPRGET